MDRDCNQFPAGLSENISYLKPNHFPDSEHWLRFKAALLLLGGPGDSELIKHRLSVRG